MLTIYTSSLTKLYNDRDNVNMLIDDISIVSAKTVKYIRLYLRIKWKRKERNF